MGKKSSEGVQTGDGERAQSPRGRKWAGRDVRGFMLALEEVSLGFLLKCKRNVLVMNLL